MEERGLAAIINQNRPIERLQFQLKSTYGKPRRFDLQIQPAANDFKIEANLWPSALVLSQYLFFQHEVSFKSESLDWPYPPLSWPWGSTASPMAGNFTFKIDHQWRCKVGRRPSSVQTESHGLVSSSKYPLTGHIYLLPSAAL